MTPRAVGCSPLRNLYFANKIPGALECGDGPRVNIERAAQKRDLRPGVSARAGVDERIARSQEMPFDGTDLYDNHPVAKLGAVERLLATEQQWCKGRLRDAYGRHCLVGAIEAVGARQMLQKPILHAAREVSGKRYWRIEFFNDDPRTTHADVLQVLQRARENMIAGMICDRDPQPWRQRWADALRALRVRSGADTGGALRSGGGHRLFADEPAAPYRGSHPAAYPDRYTLSERTVELETQQ